jgi:anti-sigma regulatory factor (Ser/Thr protein kinase)
VLRSENSWPATPEHVRDARREIADLARRAGVPDDALDAVRLAVSEAVSNAVLHGYREHGSGRGRVTVVVEAEDSRLDIRVRDRGCGISPHAAGGGAGLGLPLIAELSDAVAVRPNGDGGTEVHMTFRLPSPVAD